MNGWWRICKKGGTKFCFVGRGVVRFHYHHFLGSIDNDYSKQHLANLPHGVETMRLEMAEENT